ncbi:MAG: hypothetical protein IIU19_03325 [Oscillospiraceae bacterium]|nr:hypothetical protein [Oscillospiraceae bacterium]
MKGYLFRLLNHEELSREEMKSILIGITQSEYPNEQITALLTCLQMRGVTVDELLGFRDGILETGVPAILQADRYIDVVGTGGDRKNTFNISTTSCFVIAGAGYKVAGFYGFRPVAEVLVRQGGHQVQAVIPPPDLYLPGRRAGQLHRPGYPGLPVLYRRKRKPIPHRHGAPLAEPADPQGMPGPGAFQHRFLNAFRLYPALRTPHTANPVQEKRAGRVPFREGCHPAQVHAGEQIQHHRRSPVFSNTAETTTACRPFSQRTL